MCRCLCVGVSILASPSPDGTPSTASGFLRRHAPSSPLFGLRKTSLFCTKFWRAKHKAMGGARNHSTGSARARTSRPCAPRLFGAATFPHYVRLEEASRDELGSLPVYMSPPHSSLTTPICIALFSASPLLSGPGCPCAVRVEDHRRPACARSIVRPASFSAAHSREWAAMIEASLLHILVFFCYCFYFWHAPGPGLDQVQPDAGQRTWAGPLSCIGASRNARNRACPSGPSEPRGSVLFTIPALYLWSSCLVAKRAVF